MFDRYAKAVWQAVAVGAGTVTLALSDGVFTSEEVGATITSVLGSLALVWAIPKFWLGAGKAIASAAGTAGGMWLTAYADGVVSGNEWYGIFAAVVAAVGSYIIPNARTEDDVIFEQQYAGTTAVR